MKIIFTLITMAILGFSKATLGQSCTAAISGGNCVGNVLTAIAQPNNLAKLRWVKFGGTYFYADTVSNSNSVSVVAGSGSSGASLNQFGFPAGGITMDKLGNIYVADKRNNRVMKWAPGANTGVLVAGGHGAGNGANQLDYPFDVFVDTAFNIYISDYNNHRVQKWAPGASSGITVAGGKGVGNGANQLYAPTGIIVDINGDLYIADTYNYRIQKWKPGAVRGTTVAGSTFGYDNKRFSLPVDVYLDGAKNIYVADAATNASHNRVQKWAKGDTIGVTVAGGNGDGQAANQISDITAIYVDASGNLYLADAANRRVVKWANGATSGTTVAGGYGIGSNLNQIYYGSGIHVDADKNVFVLDGANYVVKKFKATNGIVENTFIPKIAGSYTVEATFKNGCTVTSYPIIIYDKPQPDIQLTPTGSRDNLCGVGIVDTFLVYPQDAITTNTWVIPPSCSLIANKGDTIIVGIPNNFQNGRIVVSSTNICGVGKIDTMGVIGYPSRPQGIAGKLEVLPNEQGVLYRVTDKFLNYTWTVPVGSVIVSGQNSSRILVNFGTQSGLVSVVASNACGSSRSKEKAVTIKQNKGVLDYSLFEDQKFGLIKVTPMPAKDNINIFYRSTTQCRALIQLSDIEGRCLDTRTMDLKKGMNTIPFEINKFPKGIYVVRLINNNTILSTKLIKQ